MENRDDDFDGRDWLEAELADTLDEDYELEISEPALSLEIRKIYRKAHPPSIPRMEYFRALLRLQSELIKLQDWVSYKKEKIVVIFEGRDSAGKGGVIKRITESLNPRACRVVALSKPTEKERTQWYFQRYVEHLPSAGEIVLFDRSWYNRAGVEKVMGFCSEPEYQSFLDDCPKFERMLVNNGILLFKYWFGCDQKEQEQRLAERLTDPIKRWKISPIDLAARERYADYTAARDRMLEATNLPEAPWTLVDMNDQKRGRLNTIRHLLDHLPDHDVAMDPLELPPLSKRAARESYPRGVARAKTVY